jgi:hypothetical protein
MTCYRPGARSRFFYKGERRSMSEADYANLITAAHNHLAAPPALINGFLAQTAWSPSLSPPRPGAAGRRPP